MLASFSSGHVKLLTEYRGSFQNAVRNFQSELDEFMLQIQKESNAISSSSGTTEANSPLKVLIAMVDYNGYHTRRNGFDQRKYASF